MRHLTMLLSVPVLVTSATDRRPWKQDHCRGLDAC
jgi:hypothetical protein